MSVRDEIAKIISSCHTMLHDDNYSSESIAELNLRLNEFFEQWLPGNPNKLVIGTSRRLIEARNLFTLLCIAGCDVLEKEDIPDYLLPEVGLWTTKNAHYHYYPDDSFVLGKTKAEKRDEKLNDLI